MVLLQGAEAGAAALSRLLLELLRCQKGALDGKIIGEGCHAAAVAGGEAGPMEGEGGRPDSAYVAAVRVVRCMPAMRRRKRRWRVSTVRKSLRPCSHCYNQRRVVGMHNLCG